MDRLGRWILFLRVAETGSFSRAAEEAGIGQPQASRAISALEAEVGARLFLRSTRRLTLTEAGLRALPHVRGLIDQTESLDAAIAGHDRRMSGRLRIAGSVAHAAAEIVPHMADFLEAFPDIEVDLRASDARDDLVAAGLDLAFRLGELDDSSFMARRLGSYERVLVATPDFLGRAEAIRQPQDLLKQPVVGFSAVARQQTWRMSRKGQQVAIDVAPRLQASSGPLVLDLVAQDLGVALLPSFLVREDLEAGRLQRVLADWAGPQLALHALWPSGGEPPRRVRAFLDFIVPRLAVGEGGAPRGLRRTPPAPRPPPRTRRRPR